MVSTNDEVLNEVSSTEVAQSVPSGEVITISEEDLEKAQKTFQSGKKHLFLNKFDEAVNNIGDACKIYSSKFGELDPKCAEIYFFYGRALLELARVENTVLGNALSGVPDDTGPFDDSRFGNPEDLPAEEKKQISDQVIDALCDRDEKPANEAAASSSEAPAENQVEMGEAKVSESAEKAEIVEKKEEVESKVASEEAAEPKKAEEDEKIEAEEKNGEKAAANDEEEGEDDEEDDEEGEDAEDAGEDLTKNDEQVKDEAEAEEISNLQRSWEMFELAKIIYAKNFEEDKLFKHKRVAECLLKLGEISIEQEIYDQAITDIAESIRLQEEQKEEKDDRMLAESYYQLGLAQQFNNLFTEANSSFQKSINIMNLKIEKLKGRLELATDIDESEKNLIKDEISELEALLPEMSAKLEEVNEQSLSLIKEAKEVFANSIASGDNNGVSNGSSASLNASANGEIKDITGLVKSKRKIGAGEDTSVFKKTRLSGEAEAEAVPVAEAKEAAAAEAVAEVAAESVEMKEDAVKVVDQVAPEANGEAAFSEVNSTSN